MVKRRTKSITTKFASVMLSSAMVTSMLPTMYGGTTAFAAEEKIKQTLYYNLDYITNYKALNKDDKILLISQDVKQGIYNGKQGVLNIPEGSAKLSVYNLVDAYDYSDVEKMSLDEALDVIYDIELSYGFPDTFEKFQAYEYKDEMLSDSGYDPSNYTEEQALDTVVNYMFYGNEDIEIKTWSDIKPAYKAKLKDSYEEYYKEEYDKAPTDEELAEYLNEILGSTKYDSHWGTRCKEEHIEALVDVIEKGRGFDNCKSGTIGYKSFVDADDIKNKYSEVVTGEGWWYSCNGGGVYYVGPFYLYSYDECEYTEDDITVVKDDDFPDGNPASVTKDKIRVRVKADGKNIRIPDEDFELLNDGAITDGKIAVKLGNITKTLPIGEKAKEYNVTFRDGKGSGSGSYEEGETVTLSALDINGKEFSKWEGLSGLTVTNGSSTSKKVSFTMPAKNVEVQATYTTAYNITLRTKGEGGTVTVDKKKAAKDETVELTIKKDEGVGAKITAYKTDSKSTTVKVSSKNTFTMPAYDVTVVVEFIKGYEEEKLEAGPAAPTGLKGVATTYKGAKDGKITGVNDTMEYSADGGKTWTSVKKGAKTVTDLAAGEYRVRVKETDKKEAGAARKVTVAEGPSKNVTAAEKKTNTLSLNAGLKVKHNGSSVSVSWGKVKDADAYEIYANYCGQSKMYKVATVKGAINTKVSFNKINKTKLNNKKNIKVYVKAVRTVAGKKLELGKTVVAHVVGKSNSKYTNAKGITLAKSSYEVKVGKTVAIKAKTVLVDSKKKQLSDGHAKEFRFASANEKIATVNKAGKIKGVKKGTTTIYVYSRNGYTKKVKVTVK